jgi:hypothetical protein
MADTTWHRAGGGLEIRLERIVEGWRWRAWRRIGGRGPVSTIQSVPRPADPGRIYDSVDAALIALRGEADALAPKPRAPHAHGDGPHGFGCC